MSNKVIAGVVIVLVLVGAAWLIYSKADANGASTNTEQTTVGAGAETGKKPGKATPYFDWKFTASGERVDTGAPKTKVTLMSNDHAYDVGTYLGSCSRISSKNLQVGEVDGVLCWFAGGGDELGIFKEGDSFVVKKRQVDEGTAETPSTPTAFTAIVQLQEM